MMSASPLGYPVTSAPPVSMAQALLTPPGASPKSSNRGSPCCENGRPVLTNPLTGQILCSCQYSPSSAAAAAAAAALYSGFPRIQISAASPVSVAGLPEALYSSAALAAHAHLLPFATVSPETAAQFYSGLASGYDYKGLASPAGLSYPFDPSLAAYPFGNGFLDPNARRKNATRESTATLKAWLNEHKKNPYPTKGEKIMLAIITKMTLTQVSTWFANARRRLKKDHKMTWEPRNRMDDEDDDDDRDDRQSAASDLDDAHDADLTSGLSGGMEATEEENISVDSDEEEPINPLRHSVKELSSTSPMATASTATRQSGSPHSPEHKATSHSDTHKDAPLKPKIWSMAEIATSNTNNSGNFRYGIKDIVPNMGLEALHQNKMPSAHAQALHPAWRGAHPYLQAHMLAQSRLAALSYPAHRLPTNPFSVPTSLPSALLHEARAASAFVPIANIPKASST